MLSIDAPVHFVVEEAGLETTTFDAIDTIGDPSVTHYWKIRAVDCRNITTADSNIVAEFEFEIVPGD
jgi:hypothetical protein